MVDEKVLDSFHMLWDNFPSPVRLIHKNRTVIAINEAAKNAGWKAGVPCYSIGNPESHKACRANEALSTSQGEMLYMADGRIKFWIPVKNYRDVYVHFVVTISAIETFGKTSP